MKRHASLIKLSREHHTALVLAKHAVGIDPANACEVAAFASRLQMLMESEIEPHFQREETALMPLLEQYDLPLVERTREEHRLLRELAARIAAGDAAAIAHFGRGLEGHVHFEERKLFPVAEAVLSAPELQRLVDSY